MNEIDSKKKATKKTTKTTTAKTKKPTRKKANNHKITFEKRYQMIAESAYHMAEKQDFTPDNDLNHWLEAEIKIDHWINSENIQLSK